MKKITGSGYLLVLIATIGFGLKAVLVKLIYAEGVDVISLLVARGFISTPLFLGATLLKYGRGGLVFKKKEIFGVMNITIIGLMATMFLSYFTLNLLQASLASLIFYTYPVFTFIVLVFLRESIGIEKYISFAITIAGLYFLLQVEQSTKSLNLVGVALGFLTALSFGYYNAFSSKLIQHISPLKISNLSVLVINFVLLFFLPYTDFNISLNAWLLILALALFSGFIAFLCFLYGMQKLGASKAVVTNSLTPVFSVLFAGMFLGERMGFFQLVGITLIITGVLSLRLPLQQLLAFSGLRRAPR